MTDRTEWTAPQVHPLTTAEESLGYPGLFGDSAFPGGLSAP